MFHHEKTTIDIKVTTRARPRAQKSWRNTRWKQRTRVHHWVTTTIDWWKVEWSTPSILFSKPNNYQQNSGDFKLNFLPWKFSKRKWKYHTKWKVCIESIRKGYSERRQDTLAQCANNYPGTCQSTGDIN